MPGESLSFTPSSILFRPHQMQPPEKPDLTPAGRVHELSPLVGFSGGHMWWRRRVLPPGPMGLLRQPFIAISGFLRHTEYSGLSWQKKEF